MKTKKASNKALKHILCCIILLIAFVITFTKVHAQNETTNVIASDTEDTVPLKPQLNKDLLELKRIEIGVNKVKIYDNPRIIEKNIEYYINKYEKTLTFFADAFGYSIESIKNDLIERNKDVENINETNIATIKDELGNIITYPNTEYGIVEYFYELVNTNRLERTKKLVPYTGNSDYVDKLILYYTNIYTNVDSSIALSIGAAESGYYQVKYMLRMNNVYGGMSSYGLIRHENIELGVLSYIRMLSLKYFGKGLTTIYDIGYVYCPTINEYGYKTASPHWINLVNKAKLKYDNYINEITINDLINNEI